MMRAPGKICVGLSAMWMTGTVAQELPDESLRDLLCEQCPYDAPVRISPRIEMSPGLRTLPYEFQRLAPEPAESAPFDLGLSIANMRGLNTTYGARTLSLLNSRRMTAKEVADSGDADAQDESGVEPEEGSARESDSAADGDKL